MAIYFLTDRRDKSRYTVEFEGNGDKANMKIYKDKTLKAKAVLEDEDYRILAELVKTYGPRED